MYFIQLPNLQQIFIKSKGVNISTCRKLQMSHPEGTEIETKSQIYNTMAGGRGVSPPVCI